MKSWLTSRVQLHLVDLDFPKMLGTRTKNRAVNVLHRLCFLVFTQKLKGLRETRTLIAACFSGLSKSLATVEFSFNCKSIYHFALKGISSGRLVAISPYCYIADLNFLWTFESASYLQTCRDQSQFVLRSSNNTRTFTLAVPCDRSVKTLLHIHLRSIETSLNKK